MIVDVPDNVLQALRDDRIERARAAHLKERVAMLIEARRMTPLELVMGAIHGAREWREAFAGQVLPARLAERLAALLKIFVEAGNPIDAAGLRALVFERGLDELEAECRTAEAHYNRGSSFNRGTHFRGA